MLLHDARRHARLDEVGDLVLLEEQDRSRWDRTQIDEALPLVGEAFRGRQRSRTPCRQRLRLYIAARRRPKKRTGRKSSSLYDFLERLHPSPIVSLNRAVAVAMAHGIRPALTLIDALAKAGDLDDYHLLHSTRADLLRRLGSSEEAAGSYARALELVTNESERRFLESRLREVQPERA